MRTVFFMLVMCLLVIGCKNNTGNKTLASSEIKENHMEGEQELIKVDESNFTVAETDRYMRDHSKEYSVNTFRHSRSMSSKDNQFVVRENQDVMYSHAVVDISEGATLVNPEWDVFSVIQVIDENQYTIDVLYPGESRTFTTEDVALGDHLFLNMRTGVRTLDEAGFEEAHEHQDQVLIKANSDKPYKEKGFDPVTLDETRKRLKARMAEANQPKYFFGNKDEVEETQFLIASAVGIFGLPLKDAAYLNTIQPPEEVTKEGKCATLTLPVPPLKYDEGGFFSVTTYDEKGWIATDNFALNHRQAEPNADGKSYTFHFNCPGEKNNIDVVKNWTVLIRLYMPESEEAILEYIDKANEDITFQLAE